MSPLRQVDVDHRHAGLRALREAQMWEGADPQRSETAYRSAVKHLVEAFLEDRQANHHLFVIAHRAGAVIEERFGCIYQPQPGGKTFRLDCPIDKLHSRIGASVAMITESECSICGAGDLDCDHVPGQQYDGQDCSRVVTNIVSIDHVALTPDPDFAYTFIGQPDMTLEELVEYLGRAPRPGEVIRSRHCRDCYGQHHTKPDDLDPTLWGQD